MEQGMAFTLLAIRFSPSPPVDRASCTPRDWQSSSSSVLPYAPMISVEQFLTDFERAHTLFCLPESDGSALESSQERGRVRKSAVEGL